MKVLVDTMGVVLLEKNRRYGNSALALMRVFSKAAPHEGILVRMDDQLSRIANRKTERPRVNDLADLVGYCFLEMESQGVTRDDLLSLLD